MKNIRTHVALPEDLVAAIDSLVGKRGRSSFLADAAWREVKRRRLLQLLQQPDPIWKPQDHPELQDGGAAWVDRRAQTTTTPADPLTSPATAAPLPGSRNSSRSN